MKVWLGGISPQDLDHTRQTKEELNLPFALLSDKGNEFARKCGLVYSFPDGIKEVYRNLGINLPEYNGEDSWVLPIPTTFAVESSGMVSARWIDPDFTRLEDPENVLHHLEQVMAKASA
jgi:peroxiredoxin